MMEGLSTTTGEYLHNIYKKNPSEKSLHKMIDAVPSSLSYKYKEGQLPIQTAVCCGGDFISLPYITFLAIEGVKHNVGGANKRGGLLFEDPFHAERDNVLQMLADFQKKPNSEPYDSACFNVLKGLTESNLFFKKDVQDYDLLLLSCSTARQLRFEHLAQTNPEGLQLHRYDGRPIIHAMINARDTSESFQLFLSTALATGAPSR